MKFIIQYNLINEQQLLKIKDAVDEHPHEYVSVLPFSHEIKSDNVLDGVDYIPYGSTLFVKLAKELNWKGLYFDRNKFNYSEALKNRDDMLNENVITAENAIKLLKEKPENSEWFIRPSHDLKQFSGMTMTAKQIAEWLEQAILIDSSTNEKVELNTDVVVSKNKYIKAEWRWFIVNRKVISGSMYRCKGQVSKEKVIEKTIIDEAQKLAEKWLPHENCVMDLALVENDLRVIEFNGINASGFYDHNVKDVFNALWNYEKENK